MECLELYCDLLLARIGLIETQKYGNEIYNIVITYYHGVEKPTYCMICIVAAVLIIIFKLKLIIVLHP